MRRYGAVSLALLALAMPAGAHAQSANPLAPPTITPVETTTTPTTTSSSTSSGGGGLSSGAEVGIFAGGIILIAAIAMVILRDARSRAPVTEEDLDAQNARTQRRAADTKARRRARGKHAKRKRRYNRPR